MTSPRDSVGGWDSYPSLLVVSVSGVPVSAGGLPGCEEGSQGVGMGDPAPSPAPLCWGWESPLEGVLQARVFLQVPRPAGEGQQVLGLVHYADPAAVDRNDGLQVVPRQLIHQKQDQR